jgi:hypothetical protein
MNDPTKPVIKLLPSASPFRTTNNLFSNFGVKAHPSGSASNLNHYAIDAFCMSSPIFSNLRFFSNGTGSCGIFIFVRGGANQFTYNVTIQGTIVAGCVGPGYVVKTSDGGLGFIYNPNLVYIRDSWIYANSNMIAAFDMSFCTKYTVEQGLIESTGNYGVILGSQGRIADNWFESQAIAPLQFQTTASVASAGNVMQSNYFSGFSGAFVIPSGANGNYFLSNAGGAYTYTKNSVDYLNISNDAFPAAPVLTQTIGATGTLALVSATIFNRQSGTYVLFYTFTPAAPGAHQFTITPPTGFSVTSTEASVVDGNSVIPYACGVAWPLTSFFVSVPNTNVVQILVQCTVQ